MAWAWRICFAGLVLGACNSSPEPGPILQSEESVDASTDVAEMTGGAFFPGVKGESRGPRAGGESSGVQDAGVIDDPGSSAVTAPPPSPGITSAGPAAPTGIASTPGVPATTGGAGAGGVGVTGGAGRSGRDDEGCAALERDYATALVGATACDFFALGPTCQREADTSLACPGCKVAVQDPVRLFMIRSDWESSGCDRRGRSCPPIVCANLERGICVPLGAAGACSGTTAVGPALTSSL